MSNYNNELEQFIYEVCYDLIYNEVSKHVFEHSAQLDLRYSRVKDPDTARLTSMIIAGARNIHTNEDQLSFDATLDCTIELEKEGYRGPINHDHNQWLEISCNATIEDRLTKLNVSNIKNYKPIQKSTSSKSTASTNIVPIIRKDDLDDEATSFLERYYPEAISNAIPVPIHEIIKDNMGLNVIHGHKLSDDFSIFGQICLSKNNLTLYNIFENEERQLEVERGTILIDPYTYINRNFGCVNNTLAHEAFHWHRHRLYAAIKTMVRKENIIAHRCPAHIKYVKGKPWTDEERMEWQANKIAPRILMPLDNFTRKVKQLYQEYGYTQSDQQDQVLECIIDELANFYKVSKQSAKIRLIDIGHTEAANVYNYEDHNEPTTENISYREAFYEYSDNEEFRKIVDSGSFRYVDGHYVIADPKYVTVNSDGTVVLSQYALDNIDECTLKFTYHQVNIEKHGEYHQDIFHRTNINTYAQLPQYDSNQNTEVIQRAHDLQQKREQFDSQYAIHELSYKSFWEKVHEILVLKKWNAVIFADKTLLHEINFSHAVNNHSSLPSIRTVIAICAGLDLDINMTNELLHLAGHALNGSREHQALSFAITAFGGQPIEARNEFLIDQGFDPLGSKQRK